jgi:hypothetical protein
MRTVILFIVTSVVLTVPLPAPATERALEKAYFPPPESQGGWRKLEKPNEIRRIAGMDPDRLSELKDWLMQSDKRNFAAVVIRNGYMAIVPISNERVAPQTVEPGGCI